MNSINSYINCNPIGYIILNVCLHGKPQCKSCNFGICEHNNYKSKCVTCYCNEMPTDQYLIAENDEKINDEKTNA